MRTAIAALILAARLQAGQAPPAQPPNPPGAAGPAQPGAPLAKPTAEAPASRATFQPGATQAGPVPPALAQPGPPVHLTLEMALRLARAYSQQFLSAGIAAQLAHEDRVQARAAFFPTLNAFNQYIYTQGNGTPSGVFVANDGVHVYNEQAVVHAELFSVARRAEYQRAVAAEAAAQARVEIAARGLIATVAQDYYAVVIAQRRQANARRSLDEAARFLDITEKQERGGEAAHADVVKAQLQYQQRQRDLMDADNNLQKARIALGVLLFPSLEQPYDVTDDLRPDLPLPPLNEIRSQALTNSPDLRAAESALQQAGYGVRAARGAYYPSLVLDYFYGFDANVFNITGPDDRRNLGSVVQATVNVPVWNWGATRSRVRQAQLQQRQAQYDLTFTERQLQANINAFYLEAQAARAQLESLRSSLELATESLRLTVLRYQGGEATALEVADAQTTLVQARNAYDDGLARYRIALVELQTLTGRF
jgi:outer membrane protein TolC